MYMVVCPPITVKAGISLFLDEGVGYVVREEERERSTGGSVVFGISKV